MRKQTVTILIAATLVAWGTQSAIAKPQPTERQQVGDIDTATQLGTPRHAQTADKKLHLQGDAVFGNGESEQEKSKVKSQKSNTQYSIPDAQYSDYLAPLEQQQFRREVGFKVVRDIQIRFVNNKGKPVDDKGQPIGGRTRKDYIIGSLRLKQGEAFRRDVLEADLQRLRRLEPFEDVKVSLEEDKNGVKVVYDIKERRYPSYSFGGGSNGDVGLYGTVGYRDANISGVSDRLGVNLLFSRKDIQFNGEFTSPYRYGEPNRFGYSVRVFRNRDFSRTFNDDIKLSNGSAAREGRLGGGASLLRSFNDWDAALGLNYTRISIRDNDYIVARRDRLESPVSVSGTGIDDLVTVSLGVTRDRRDRRIDPTQGSVLSFSTEQALPIGLGGISSNRLLANYIQYIPMSAIGRGRQTDDVLPEMLAFNLQAGTTFGEFPPADAFDLGGPNSVRGYDRGKVASGRSYGLASVEYRFPIARPGGLVRSLGGVVFADFASDFGSGKTVLGQPGVLRNKPGSGFGYGAGLRVNTPFALIRGDLGISDRGEVRFEVTTGQRF